MTQDSRPSRDAEGASEVAQASPSPRPPEHGDVLNGERIGDFDGTTTTVPCGMCNASGVEPEKDRACDWCDGTATLEALGEWRQVHA